MDQFSAEYAEIRRSIKKESEAKQRRKSRWNDPETQAIEAQRREMYAEAERDRIKSLKEQIPKLRSELHKEDKLRAVKEAELRSLVATLDELTGPEVPAVVEPDPEEPVAEPAPVEADAPRRGRPKKVAQ